MKKFFNKSNSQIVSSRINEVHCGILEIIKRYRNSLHSCGMTALAKAVAFTLAETLVVMGIIGVVAALTIPNLNQSTGDREKVAKVKKIYANLEDAFGRATAVYGPVDEWGFTDANSKLESRILEFMKISKDCDFMDEGCFASSYKMLDGGEGATPNDWDERKVMLADGAALDFEIRSKDCSNDLGATSDSPLLNVCAEIYVDIDGVKGSNTHGKDMFTFYIAKTGVYPSGGQNEISGADNDKLTEECFKDGYYCAGWVIETGNMDYLKASNGECPNGTTLSWENTSCK